MSMTRLTPAERIVYEALATGERTKVIAHRLGKSPRTVDSQRRCVFKKFGVATHIELLAKLLKEAREVNNLGIAAE